MKSIYQDSLSQPFRSGLRERFLGGMNSFDLNIFMNFLIKNYNHDINPSTLFDISEKEVDRYYLSSDIGYQSVLYYEKIPARIFWKRMTLGKNKYKNEIQDNFFTT